MNNLYIVWHILSELGKPESLITFVESCHGHDQRHSIDPLKINVKLSRNSVTALEEGIVKAIK